MGRRLQIHRLRWLMTGAGGQRVTTPSGQPQTAKLFYGARTVMRLVDTIERLHRVIGRLETELERERHKNARLQAERDAIWLDKTAR